MTNQLSNKLAKDAYEVISQQQPKMAAVIRDLVEAGQTPGQIGRFVLRKSKSTFLASLAEMAAAYLKAQPKT